jgi:hypothetical protein
LRTWFRRVNLAFVINTTYRLIWNALVMTICLSAVLSVFWLVWMVDSSAVDGVLIPQGLWLVQTWGGDGGDGSVVGHGLIVLVVVLGHLTRFFLDQFETEEKA